MRYAILLLAVSCAASSKETELYDVSSDAPEVFEVAPESVSQIEWTVSEDPLAIHLTMDGRPVASFTAPDGHAFYLFDSETLLPVDLVTPAVAERTGDRTIILLATGDGRRVSIEVRPDKEGAAEISFTVEGKKEHELLGARIAVTPEEGFYGLMERVVPGGQHESWKPGITRGFDLRGLEVEMFVRPTVAVYSPFLVSSSGYGVFVKSDWPGTFDLARYDPSVMDIRYEGPSLLINIIPGPALMDVTARYARIVGTTILPPKWAFGPWRWRDEHMNMDFLYDGTPNPLPFNSMVVEDVLMMEAFGIPCSVYWVDRPWGPGPFGYDDLEWDEIRFPNPKQMIEWLAARNIRFLLWIVDWAVGPKMLAEAEAKGYLTTAEFPSQSGARLIDLTNPDAVTWWQDALGVRLADGLAGFKCDRGEEKEPDGLIVQGTYYDGTSFREGHNANPLWYAKAVYGALERAGLTEWVTIFRAAWTGSQKYTMVWAGDTNSSEWGLRSAIIGMLRSAVMGFPLWGSDTCGYSGTPDREVCMRWLAFSAFSPLMEVGPTWDLAPWAWPEANAEPYDEELIATWILYANVHDSLKDYSYEQAKKAHEDGTMFVRPMIFAYPDREEYKDMFDQYLFGPDILVAPVWQKGMTEREVHIPPGTWVDAWTRKSLTGPKTVVASAKKHQIPVYIRQGAAVDLGDLNQMWEAALVRAHQRPDLSKLAVWP